MRTLLRLAADVGNRQPDPSRNTSPRALRVGGRSSADSVASGGCYREGVPAGTDLRAAKGWWK